MIAFCPTHPLHQAWLSAWPSPQGISTWYATTTPRDKFLIGKLVIPNSLHAHLSRTQGPHPALAQIRRFQRAILPIISATLNSLSPLPPMAPQTAPPLD